MVCRVCRTMRSSVPCRTSPRGGAMFSPLDKQQEHILLPVECQQERILEDDKKISGSCAPLNSLFAVVRRHVDLGTQRGLGWPGKFLRLLWVLGGIPCLFTCGLFCCSEPVSVSAAY